MSFQDWMKKVDVALAAKCGLESADLPDCCYTDWHEDGVSPSRAAAKAIRAANGGDLY